jgi:hypothetical protein
MNDDAAPQPRAPAALHSFACAACGLEAGLVRLFGEAAGGEIIRDSFTSRLTFSVDAGEFARVRELVLAGDALSLYELDAEVASFYCPECRACYCGAHWTHRDVFDDEDGFLWHDSIRGRCPSGHERMLED